MSTTQITFRAIAPIYSPLSLHLGVDQFSIQFVSSLKAMNLAYIMGSAVEQSSINWQGEILHLGGEKNEERQYQSTDENSKDIRLLCWKPIKNSQVMFHVFTNHIAVAEIEITLDIAELQTHINSSEQLVNIIETKVQDLAETQIKLHRASFNDDMKKLSLSLSDDFILSEQENQSDVSWVARTMLIEKTQLAQPSIKALLTEWLRKTGRPNDAADLIEGKIEYSMTWLNYVVKDAQSVGNDKSIQMMILSQYYYVSQENCNNALRGAIEQAYSRGRKPQINKMLSNTRAACRLNRIAYFEYIKFLNKPNRALLEDILSGWKFDQLVENSERMIEVCNGRLQEEDNKKRERSTVMTDFILVALSFFAVFELSLYLTEFSREMMSRPALDYNDNKSSFFLGLIAEVDADIMFSFGFGLTLLLILIYRYIKRN